MLKPLPAVINMWSPGKTSPPPPTLNGLQPVGPTPLQNWGAALETVTFPKGSMFNRSWLLVLRTRGSLSVVPRKLTAGFVPEFPVSDQNTWGGAAFTDGSCIKANASTTTRRRDHSGNGTRFFTCMTPL